MRLQFTVDDTLGVELQEKAHKLGFSVSSYVRHLVKLSLSSKKTSVLEKAIQEQSEPISLENFRKQLGL